MTQKLSITVSLILRDFHSDIENIASFKKVNSSFSRMVEAFARKLENDEPDFEWNEFYDSCFKPKE